VNVGLLIQALVMYGPGVYKALVEIFANPAPTKADLLAVLDKIDQTSYDSYIADAKARAAATHA
jgi:hypothetical protein